jgi:hypothetical protein
VLERTEEAALIRRVAREWIVEQIDAALACALAALVVLVRIGAIARIRGRVVRGRRRGRRVRGRVFVGEGDVGLGALQALGDVLEHDAQGVKDGGRDVLVRVRTCKVHEVKKCTDTGSGD